MLVDDDAIPNSNEYSEILQIGIEFYFLTMPTLLYVLHSFHVINWFHINKQILSG